MIYLATAPKSNAAYVAFGAAKRAAKESGSLMPPMHAVNAPTKLMRELGYSEGYVYDPSTEEGFSGLNYFPDSMPRQKFYAPFETRLRARDQEAARLLGKAAASEGEINRPYRPLSTAGFPQPSGQFGVQDEDGTRRPVREREARKGQRMTKRSAPLEVRSCGVRRNLLPLLPWRPCRLSPA